MIRFKEQVPVIGMKREPTSMHHERLAINDLLSPPIPHNELAVRVVFEFVPDCQPASDPMG